jgi:hypothetical protein
MHFWHLKGHGTIVPPLIFNQQHLLSTYCEPDLILGFGEVERNKAEVVPVFE